MNDFKIKLRQRNIPEESLLSDLKRVAEQLQVPTITASEYTAHGQYGVNTFLRRYKKWNIALQQAGLEAPNRQNIPESELFENIANTWTALGRQPTGKDMEKANGVSTFSLGTYEKRFSSWNNALLAFQTYINNEGATAPPPSRSKQPVSLKRTNRKVNWRLRAQVLIRDNCICQMCGASPSKDPSVILHADHITPWSKGGETVLENLQTLCAICNMQYRQK
jgi:hypothetical protein